MSQSEAELASLLIGRKDMRLRTVEWNVPQRYNRCCWGNFRAFGVTGLKEEILKLRLREIKNVFLSSFSLSSFKDKARSHRAVPVG